MDRADILRVTPSDLERALRIAPEMAWMLDASLVRFAIRHVPRIPPSALRILLRRSAAL